MILSNIDVWLSFFLRMVVIISTSEKAKTKSITSTTRKIFNIGLGHFVHLQLDIFWYLFPLTMFHVAQKWPVYPISRLTGFPRSEWYPPLHDLGLGHNLTSVELLFIFQCSVRTYTCNPPKHTALSIQLTHSVEFHVNE